MKAFLIPSTILAMAAAIGSEVFQWGLWPSIAFTLVSVLDAFALGLAIGEEGKG